MTMYYTELNGAEPTVSIQVKDTKYTFTNESLTRLIEEKDSLKTKLEEKQNLIDTHWENKHKMRKEIYEFFSARYETGDTEITCSKEDVNELLESIGADMLKTLWTISGRIEFTVTDIEAESEDDAYQIVENGIAIELDGDTVGDWSLDITSTDEQ
jgi:predicted RNase H-like nuclease (RuvC/YqgF family)